MRSRLRGAEDADVPQLSTLVVVLHYRRQPKMQLLGRARDRRQLERAPPRNVARYALRSASHCCTPGVAKMDGNGARPGSANPAPYGQRFASSELAC